MDELASIIIVTFNQKNYLTNCLDSLSLQDYPHEIILVDNGSNDGTIQFIEKNFEYVKIIKNTNTGFGAGTNLGVSHANGNYIVTLPPDTIIEKNWLVELIFPLRNDKNLVTTSKILMYDGLSISACGNINHFTGLTFARGLGEKLTEYNQYFSPTGIPGGCFAIKKEEYLKIGGFDEKFFLYNEDSEFSWRLHLYDYRILFVPTSIIKHDYKPGVSPEKLYLLEIGRYRILRKYLNRKEAILLIPSLFITEFLVFGYAVKCGYKGLFYKIKAVREFFSIIYDTHNSDTRKILFRLSPIIPSNQLTSNQFECAFIILCNKIFKWNLMMLQNTFPNGD
jgi:GT2 family glycosyltransferase